MSKPQKSRGKKNAFALKGNILRLLIECRLVSLQAAKAAKPNV